MFRLVLAILATESSYAQEVERAEGAVPDTVQFWLTPDKQWRVRTYAIDHDIHVYQVGSRADGSGLSATEAADHIATHYANIIAKTATLNFRDPGDQDEVRRVLAAKRLKGTLEIGKAGVAFYNPDNGEYRTKSRPN
jgi:hypothetical protein